MFRKIFRDLFNKAEESLNEKYEKFIEEARIANKIKVEKYFSEPQQLIGRWAKIWVGEREPFINGKVINIEWVEETAVIILQKSDCNNSRLDDERLSDGILRLFQNNIRAIQPYTTISDELSDTLRKMLNEFISLPYHGRPMREGTTGFTCPRCSTEIILWECNTQWGYNCQTVHCVSATCYGF